MAGQSPHSRQLIFVVGMHRSGTSALTRCLNLLGFKVAEDLLPANDANKSGFWESRAALRLNERLLGSLDRVWYDPKPIRLDVLDSEPHENFVSGAEKILKDELEGTDLAVLKDPRLSRVLPIWREAAERLGYRCAALLAARHPIEVANSLRKRDGLEPAHGLNLWITYMLEAEAVTRDMPRHAVVYEQLLDDWRAALRPAMNAIGLGKLANYRSGWRAISAFLDPGQRNHKASQGDENGGLPEIETALALYQRLSADLTLEHGETYNAVRARWAADWAGRSSGDAASDYFLAIGEGYVRASLHARSDEKPDKARDWLEKGVAAFPERAQLPYELGRLQFVSEEFDAARASFEKAIDIQPAHAVFYHHLSLTLGRLCDVDAALIRANEALERDQSTPNFYQNAGSLLLRKGDANGAEKAFRSALAIDPKFAPSLHGLSRVHEEKGDIPRAIKASQRAVQLLPSHPGFEKRLAYLKTRVANVS
ncbi:MAG: tetratricopeptide repeat protein [Henriciella sp.]|uniref:tetratricopeptide repeat protein n=1 Tax=Henriciella sp. TaxID=1968823 RepID=UPI003C767A62